MTNISAPRVASLNEITRVAGRRIRDIIKAAADYELIYDSYVKAEKAYQTADAEYAFYDNLGWKISEELRKANSHRNWLAVAWFEMLLKWNDAEYDRSMKIAYNLGRKAERLEDKLNDLENIVYDAY